MEWRAHHQICLCLAVILITQLFYRFGNTVENPLGILLVGPVAGLMTFLGFLIFLRYPIKNDILLGLGTGLLPYGMPLGGIISPACLQRVFL
jgi:putative effector of murein hydrolase LrgA (UPF0299 family)